MKASGAKIIRCIASPAPSDFSPNWDLGLILNLSFLNQPVKLSKLNRCRAGWRALTAFVVC